MKIWIEYQYQEYIIYIYIYTCIHTYIKCFIYIIQYVLLLVAVNLGE